jgi:hypothetical protein
MEGQRSVHRIGLTMILLTLTNGIGSEPSELRPTVGLILYGWIREMPRTTLIHSYSIPTAQMAVLPGRPM